MAELEEQLEFPKQLLGQFMNDYQHYGKYNLEVQVPHLEKLAGFYERRYKLTEHWTDCVKAHALYNSISARDPQSQVWKHRAFKVQQQYWGDNCSISFEQQQVLTSSLKTELESIRNQSRTDMLAADKLANCFDGAAVTSKQNADFFAHMRDISLEVSERMASFAGKIIKECVQVLKPTKPPCDFEAAAIGSIARGEATPYSDLEFFFLVADHCKESVEYLERLAVTTYFQIANLEETKLSYMAIKELKGWFDDKAKNGFKIDGLSDQAGNIPTGNGSSNQHNHFIVTPNYLAKRYKKILQYPDKEKALSGDLTAMLSYTKLLYSHDANKKDLIIKVRKKTGELTMNRKRRKANIEMLETDNSISDKRDDIAACHTWLGNDSKAVILLERITVKSGHVHYALGDVYLRMKEYDKSEQSYLEALEYWYRDINIEQQYDYYGNPIVSDVPAGITKISFPSLTSPEERLEFIVNGSNGVIHCVIALGMVYSGKRQFTLSNDYYFKALHLIRELHGTGAAVPNAALTLCELGNNYKAMGQHSEAEDYYKKALAVYGELSQGANRRDVARTLNNLGRNSKAMGQHSEAEDYYKQALAVYRQLSQGADSSDIAGALNDVGIDYNEAGQYNEAEDYFKEALAVYRELSQGADSSDIAHTLNNLGNNYKAMGQYGDAEDYYKQALTVYRELSQGADSSDIARTLNNLGINYNSRVIRT